MDNRISRPFSAASRGRRTGTIALAGVAALAAAIGLAGCSSSASSSGHAAAANQTLKIGFSAEPPGFKTGVDQGSANKQLLTLVRRGLLAYGPKGDVVPALAASFKVSDDGLTYTFTLRDKLAFSDGKPLTSADVKRTFEFLAVPANGAADQVTFANITTIATPDDKTVTLTLAKPQTALPKVLASPLSAIVPEQAVDANGVPIGDGPFKVTEYKKGVSYTLKANPDYYDASSVKLKEIDMTFMADAQTRVRALQSGQVQFIDYVAASDYAALKKVKGVKLDNSYGLYGALQFNMTQGPLAKPEVRQAIAYALDLKSLNQAGTLGNGTANGGLPISVKSEYFNKEQADHYARNLDKAKQLLASAGYSGGGFSLRLLTNSQYFGFTERAQVVKSNLEEVGITVDLVTGDYANQIAKGNSGDYDLMIGGPPAAIDDPAAISGAFLGGPTFVRSVGIDQNLYAPLLQKGAETPDGADRKAIYDQIGDVYLKDVPFVTWGMGTAAYAYSDKLEGFHMLSGAVVYSSMYSLATAQLTK
ncbi:MULTISPECIES: ABC transporter substrate-binding protein [unclassified Microbacterium]|uniref:ABC transporter substrate-binding protein n=1 Tax=unclassified Microbacterium TaxID=2609290 RepID=UPI003019D879